MSVGSTSLIAMPARWSADSVLDLAPDESSRRSAGGARAARAVERRRRRRRRAVGAVRGLGQEPVSGRRRPQRTGLQVLLPVQEVPLQARARAAAELGQWQRAGGERARRLRRRRGWPTAAPERKKRKNQSSERPRATPASSAGSGTVKDEAAAARRAQQRAQRVANGLAELQSWLRDQVLVGLSATRRRGDAQRGHADEIAARMVDAQAPGVAAVLRGLSEVPASGEGWPGRLLAEYAQLHLLARAHQRLDALPPDLAATVRSRIGYPTSRAGRARPPAGHRPLGGARRPRPAGRARPRTPRCGCAGATAAGGRCC